MPRKKKKIVKKSLKKTSVRLSAKKLDALRKRRFLWSESYTSLLMGMVVVVVGVLFGVSLFRGQHQTKKETSSIALSPTTANTPTATITPSQKIYIVKSGDDLWHISEKFYKSGYNYVDIAKANSLANPSSIFSGDKLILPTVKPGPTTISQNQTQVQPENAIKTSTYMVQKGDSLWNIAVRAYADGYKWTEIAKANNLTNPNLIFSGNVLKIPR